MDNLTGTETLIAIGLGLLPILVLVVILVLRNPQNQQRWRARKTFVDNVRPGETVTLVGEVLANDDELLSAPFTARDCVAYLASLERNVDPDDPDENVGGTSHFQCVDTILLNDGSGTAKVLLAPDTKIHHVRAQSRTLHGLPMTTVDQALEAWGATYDDMAQGFPWGSTYAKLPSDLRAVEWLVCQGARVAVIGKVSLEPSATGTAETYREAPLGVVLSAESVAPLQIIVADTEVARLAKRRRRVRHAD